MKKIEKIVVGLDLSEMDQTLISYTKYLNLILRPEKITFVHIQDDIKLSEEIIQRFPELKENVEKTYIKEMVKDADGHEIAGTEVAYKVLTGKPLLEMLNVAKDEEADLIIAGRKPSLKASGLMPKKVARRTGTHLLLIPADTKPEIKKIVVANDFSPFAKLAMADAIEMAEHSKAEIHSLNVYEVPTGFYRTGKTYEEFAGIMLENATKQGNKFLDEMDTKGVKIHMDYILNAHENISGLLMQKAKELNADMIVIGARGRTNSAALVLGSVAEQLIEMDDEIPLLVVKKKDKTFGFWEAIKRL